MALKTINTKTHMVESIVFLGLPRAGKTLLMFEDLILDRLLNGEQVYSTTWINWKHPNYHYFRDFEEVKDVRNAVIFFDEIAQPLDPRNWKDENSGVRAFFQLHGHRHNDIYGTTQDVSLVAKSALIVISEWYLISNATGFLSFGSVVVKRERLTLKDLKRPLDASDLEEFDESNDNINDAFCFDGDSKTFYLSKKKLAHPELDDDKICLEIDFCPECGSRQIPDSKGNCPKHHWIPLIKAKAPMYDTSYDPYLDENDPNLRGDNNKKI